MSIRVCVTSWLISGGFCQETHYCPGSNVFPETAVFGCCDAIVTGGQSEIASQFGSHRSGTSICLWEL